MSLILKRLSGSVVRSPWSIYLAIGEINLGIEKSPAIIFLQRAVVLGSSKGRYPQIMANMTTPHDQISAQRGLYRLPAIIQGAAQQGDPQAVFSVYLGLQVFDKPKSTSLRLLLKSISKFYGFRSRWTIPSSCRCSTPFINCLKNYAAQVYFSRFFLRMSSKSQPSETYYMTKKSCFGVYMISQS